MQGLNRNLRHVVDNQKRAIEYVGMAKLMSRCNEAVGDGRFNVSK
jgi:hypothetical protein